MWNTRVDAVAVNKLLASDICVSAVFLVITQFYMLHLGWLFNFCDMYFHHNWMCVWKDNSQPRISQTNRCALATTPLPVRTTTKMTIATVAIAVSSRCRFRCCSCKLISFFVANIFYESVCRNMRMCVLVCMCTQFCCYLLRIFLLHWGMDTIAFTMPISTTKWSECASLQEKKLLNEEGRVNNTHIWIILWSVLLLFVVLICGWTSCSLLVQEK